MATGTETRSRDGGIAASEYGAILLLVAALFVALVASGLPTTVTGRMSEAICQITGGQCEGRQHFQAPPRLPGRPPSQPAGPTTSQLTENVLNETNIGRWILDWARRNGVQIVYEQPRPGRDSSYEDAANVVHVNSTVSAEERAARVIHEVYHAQHRHDPDPRGMTLQAFVDAALAEETNGQLMAIRAHQQLQRQRSAAGRPVPDNIGYQDAYENGRIDAVRDANQVRAQRGQRRLSREEARLVAEQGGYQRVYHAMSAVYRDALEQDWRDANAAGRPR